MRLFLSRKHFDHSKMRIQQSEKLSATIESYTKCDLISLNSEFKNINCNLSSLSSNLSSLKFDARLSQQQITFCSAIAALYNAKLAFVFYLAKSYLKRNVDYIAIV